MCAYSLLQDAQALVAAMCCLELVAPLTLLRALLQHLACTDHYIQEPSMLVRSQDLPVTW